LSDAELLAIILRLGTKGSSAIDLGREVHSHFRGFRNMADADMAEWRKIKGLGIAYRLREIAGHLGVHYATVSRRLKRFELG
jgi:DNA repair protein RadC